MLKYQSSILMITLLVKASHGHNYQTGTNKLSMGHGQGGLRILEQYLGSIFFVRHC